MFFDHTQLKECEICGNQAFKACAGCGKWVCVTHGENKVEGDDEEVVFYCIDHN